MASDAADHSPTIHELVDFLFNRRETLLNNWRTACEADPSLPKIAVLSREEFNNIIPIILDTLEQQLQGQQPETDTSVAAQTHGLQRWQKSIELPGLLVEFRHLSVLLFEELSLFRELFPQADPDVIIEAQKHILILMNEVIEGSISKHDELQRLEAATRATSLEQAIQEMEALSRQRLDMLRTSSHDLRSGLSLSMGAAYFLQMDDLSSQEKQQYVDMLNRNLANVHSLLTGLMDLARLESGQEPLQLEEFDIAQLLRDLVDSVQPMAAERSLILRADGSAPMIVKTDRLKLYRIAQNLLVNALKYTPSTPDHPGMVSVSWSAENDWRWGFSIQDSGRGLPPGVLDLFHKQLRPTVEETSVLSPEEGQPVAVRPNQEQRLPERPLPDKSSATTKDKGEGVGLQIVKRLCEIIGASLEVESMAGRGTLFRIRMLMRPPR